MEFNISHWNKDRVNIENKMRGLEITPLNFKSFDFKMQEIRESVLRNYTPNYCKWNLRKELKGRLMSDLIDKQNEVKELEMLIKICSRKEVFLVEKK